MPTGYTAGVQDGTIAEFPKFAMQCARAFGALIHMRDDGMNAEITPAEPSTYYPKAIAETKEELDALVKMSEAEARDTYEAMFASEVKSHADRAAQNEHKIARYKTMLEKVRAWTPPTPDHEQLKRFMTSQLEESIDFDTFKTKPPTRTSWQDWLASSIRYKRERLAILEQSQAEDLEQVRKKNEWVRALRDSLK